MHISILREYLEQKLKVETPFPFSLERAIDDWVLLCFFVGNDFLPHLPTLDIRFLFLCVHMLTFVFREGAIDMLTNLYRKILPRTEYITENGQVHMERLSVLISEISQLEESILEKRFLKSVSASFTSSRLLFFSFAINQSIYHLRIYPFINNLLKDRIF